ncbi:hypothetical protein PoB_002395600 [Plakobranchus ocellatus]|uniref:Uncharacterized protein n=1 Tax=Plakobranchus ocellatus TaxID=259542 RepID=A0AAV3ZSH8_9GAST|nr:hypothetical protein PoB_002395600 [Plakobranchus ocellatus]
MGLSVEEAIGLAQNKDDFCQTLRSETISELTEFSLLGKEGVRDTANFYKDYIYALFPPRPPPSVIIYNATTSTHLKSTPECVSTSTQFA